MRKDEAKLQNKFIALLNKENILYYKTSGGISYTSTKPIYKMKINDNGTYTDDFRPLRQQKGFSDLIVYKQGIKKCKYTEHFYHSIPKTYFIEVKSDKGILRSSQKKI